MDQSFVLASGNFDRHVTYVAMSRHRDSSQLFYGRDEFRGGEGEQAAARARDNVHAVLSRARTKELAVDYLERGTDAASGVIEQEAVSQPSLDAEPVVEAVADVMSRPPTIDERRQQARVRWLAYRQALDAGKTAVEARLAAGLEPEPKTFSMEQGLGLGRDDDSAP